MIKITLEQAREQVSDWLNGDSVNWDYAWQWLKVLDSYDNLFDTDAWHLEMEQRNDWMEFGELYIVGNNSKRVISWKELMIEYAPLYGLKISKI